MHWEQTQFVGSVKALFPDFFHGVAVLEIGSYDVNGSIRPLFDANRYVGVDLISGPGVDVVCSGHEFRSEERFDVAISTECFEHNPFYAETFLNMARHVRPGGMVLFTCASEGRPEHGTRCSEPASSPGTLTLDQDYYRNLAEVDFSDLDLPAWFSEFRFFRNDTSHDLYFVGLTQDVGRMDRLGALCMEIERLAAETEAAFALAHSGQVDQALHEMQVVCDSAPASARDYVLARQGWLLLNAKHGDAAEATVREALTLSDAADLHWQLGNILHSTGRFAEALESARRAVDLAPDDPRFAYFLGAILQGQDRLDEAEDSLRRAAQLKPTLAEAHLQLSMVYIKRGRWADAAEAAGRATNLAPKDEGMRLHAEKLKEHRNLGTA